MESLSRISFLLLATIVVFHLFSSSGVVEAHGVVLPDGKTLPEFWCVPKIGASDADLQKALDWACSRPEVDCGPIQPGAVCSDPVTVRSRAKFAMNAYYQQHFQELNSCDFSGAAELTTDNPSYGNCKYY
ncbi:hypothetical protein HRI_002382300 [Hibiscus trionum]|uniref:X8 domain-containing protein n=1 Tax=Hibiscus trionum TaxID=183268 RepID=A0A9W7I400_HIBTR|nr:hypothetical protein HRI_002382000 [Hibiscus trionum]GMI87130.1 hypothetical protein HRI_002382300 [Hibiscus trionum]